MGVTESINGPVLVLVTGTIAIDVGVVRAVRQGIRNQPCIRTQLHHAKGYYGPWKRMPHAFGAQKHVDVRQRLGGGAHRTGRQQAYKKGFHS